MSRLLVTPVLGFNAALWLSSRHESEERLKATIVPIHGGLAKKSCFRGIVHQFLLVARAGWLLEARIGGGAIKERLDGHGRFAEIGPPRWNVAVREWGEFAAVARHMLCGFVTIAYAIPQMRSQNVTHAAMANAETGDRACSRI